MEKKVKLRRELKLILYGKFKEGYGMPKHEIKDKHNSTPYIHSQGTYDIYLKRVNAFCDWCQMEGIKDVSEARKRVKDYLHWLEHKRDDMSAWTVKTDACAIAKVFGCSIKDFEYVFPKKKKEDIKRSRLITERDKHVSKAHNEALIEFCKSTGLRRKELVKMRGTFTHKGETQDTAFQGEDGKWRVRVIGKGGKYREAEIFGDAKQIKTVVNLIQQAGDSTVWPKVNKNLDVHALRAEYACSIYRKYARPLEDCPKDEIYHCRGKKKKIRYGRAAMLIASNNLGHERVPVIAENYFWKL